MEKKKAEEWKKQREIVMNSLKNIL
jgi:hypothetical protein